MTLRKNKLTHFKAKMRSVAWAVQNIGIEHKSGLIDYLVVDGIMSVDSYINLSNKVLDISVDENKRYTTQVFEGKYATIVEIDVRLIEKIVTPEVNPEFFI